MSAPELTGLREAGKGLEVAFDNAAANAAFADVFGGIIRLMPDVAPRALTPDMIARLRLIGL